MPSTIQSAGLEVARVYGLDSDGRPLVITGNADDTAPEVAWLGIVVTEEQLHELVRNGENVLLARPEGLNGACVIVGILRQQGIANTPAELVLEASERLVVRCGSARIVLHGDGRCEVHAERISQRARGVHAIKGAAVRIN